MSNFIQLHLLTSYPPSNVNRDDMGRPKTARMGGFERLRISSQSLKRHWRTSDLFSQSLSKKIGTRTKRLGNEVYAALTAAGIAEKKAKEWTVSIAGVFGKNKKDDFEIEQLAHISPAEKEAVFALVDTLIQANRGPEKEELDFLRHDNMPVDIALFGRMLASTPEHNIEAACQVGHALSVHSVVVESDYFTAIDDLNAASESGSSHIGEVGFSAALFYSYICINRTLLIENLKGDTELANQAITALTEAAAKVTPTGKQNSFASRAYASFILAEKGEQQPRSLSVAFLKPIEAEDQAQAAIAELLAQREKFDAVYGPCADQHYTLNATTADGKMTDLLTFVAS